MTARVYPTLATSDRAAVYSNIEVDATVDAWTLKPANVTEAKVLKDLQRAHSPPVSGGGLQRAYD